MIFFWDPLEKYNSVLPSGLLNVFSILVGIGVTLLSIYYTSGEWYSVYKKFKDLGIRDGVPTRMGRDLDQNRKWMNELRKAKREVLLSGATLGGWFETAWRDFRDDLPEILKNITRFDIFLLDPRSVESKIRAKDEMYAGEKEEDSATARATTALAKLKFLMSSDELKEYWKKERIRLYLYRGTPLSVIRIDENMYFVSYLPCVSDRDCPQLTLVADGKFSLQIKQAIEKVRTNEATLRISDAKQIDDLVQELNKERA